MNSLTSGEKYAQVALGILIGVLGVLCDYENITGNFGRNKAISGFIVGIGVTVLLRTMFRTIALKWFLLILAIPLGLLWGFWYSYEYESELNRNAIVVSGLVYRIGPYKTIELWVDFRYLVNGTEYHGIVPEEYVPIGVRVGDSIRIKCSTAYPEVKVVMGASD